MWRSGAPALMQLSAGPGLARGANGFAPFVRRLVARRDSGNYFYSVQSGKSFVESGVWRVGGWTPIARSVESSYLPPRSAKDRGRATERPCSAGLFRPAGFAEIPMRWNGGAVARPCIGADRS